MTTIGQIMRAILRKAADVLPSPPSDEAPPPDADGRREGEPEEQASLHAQFQLHGSGGGSGGTIVRPAGGDGGPGEPR
jgi:hypothetical protein